MYGIFCIPVGYLEVGDRVVVVVVMRSGQRCLLRCGAATQAASTSTSLAKINCSFLLRWSLNAVQTAQRLVGQSHCLLGPV